MQLGKQVCIDWKKRTREWTKREGERRGRRRRLRKDNLQTNQQPTKLTTT
jgi:hypothetical protein